MVAGRLLATIHETIDERRAVVGQVRLNAEGSGLADRFQKRLGTPGGPVDGNEQVTSRLAFDG